MYDSPGFPGSELLSALRALRTVQAAGISLSMANASLTAPICQAHHAANLSLLVTDPDLTTLLLLLSSRGDCLSLIDFM